MPSRPVMMQGPDGWTPWVLAIGNCHRIICCECGLSHDFQFRHRGQWETEWRVSRNERSTAQVRRHMNKK